MLHLMQVYWPFILREKMEHLDHPFIDGPHLPNVPQQSEKIEASLVPADKLQLHENRQKPASGEPTAVYIEPAHAALITLAQDEKKPLPGELTSLAIGLLSATFAGNDYMPQLRELCKNGFSLDTPDPASGLTPLGYAAINAKTNKDLECIKELVKLGASVDARDASGASAWMQAATAGNVTVMRWLKNKGADVSITDNLGRTAFMRVLDQKDMQSSLMKTVISHLINTVGANPHERDNAGLTILGHALRASDNTLKVASVLIEELQKNRFELITYIRASGLDEKFDRSLSAVAMGFWENIDASEWTELMDHLPQLAAEVPQEKPTSTEFPKEFAYICREKSPNGQTILHLAASFVNDAHLIEFLIKGGADPHAKNSEGDTPLHFAASSNHIQAAKGLLQGKAQLEVGNTLGQTPLDAAQINENTEMVTLLLDAGSKNRNLPALRDSYSERISLSPPFAKVGVNNPQDPQNVQRFKDFVNSHLNYLDDSLATLPEALESMMKNTDYVSFTDFLQGFDVVIEDLNQEIRPGEEYIVLVEPKKSNKWLAELALAKLKTPPKDILRMADLQTALSAPENKGVKRIVFFDDASYSGEQMCGFIKNTAVTALDKAASNDFTINVAIPYITQGAANKIAAINQDAKVVANSGQIRLSPHKLMRAANEQVPKEHHEILTKNYFVSMEVGDLFVLQSFLELPPESIVYMEKVLRDYNFESVDDFHIFIEEAQDILEKFELSPEIERYQNINKDPRLAALAPRLVQELISFWKEKKELLEEAAANSTSFREAHHLMNFNAIMPAVVDHKEELSFDRGLESRTLTIFDHKVADYLSTCPAFEKGEVFIRGEVEEIQELFPGIVPYKQKYD